LGDVRRFEELVAWQRARELTQRIYGCTAVGAFAEDAGLRDLIRQAAVSIMSNIAEGFERGSIVEFDRFLLIAKGFCGEVRSHLYVAKDIGHMNARVFKEMMELAEEVARIISGLRKVVSYSVEKKR
jgi:four helix bundle protein